ncbi:MAG TPA: DUF932 domain-containing protein [Bryobacteraceae bacterium]|jgi:hypothetical protein|nr:DUF932 domain-containing protein [Bryobacteraceae bacterium]
MHSQSKQLPAIPPTEAIAGPASWPVSKFSDLVALADWRDREYVEVPLGHGELKFVEEGLRFDGRILKADRETRLRLLAKVGAPTAYWEEHTPSFQAEALSEHARRFDFGREPKAVLQNGDLFTLVDPDLTNLSIADVLRAIAEELGADADHLLVARIEDTGELVEAELFSPMQATEVRRGDVVQSGISVLHAPYGKQATQIQAFIYRLICSNGMTRRECVSRDNIVRTRRLPPDRYANARELQLSQIRRLVRRTWTSLRAHLDAFRATRERGADVEELLQQWLLRGRISTNGMMPRLLAAWREEGSDDSIYGAINALTRLATHDRRLSSRQRRTFASLAGLLAFRDVHLCPRCFSVLGHGQRGGE